MRNDFESNYLAHWGLKKGAQKEDHKYYARIDLPSGKYRYFYTMAEYKAYLGSKDTNKKESVKDKILKLIKKKSQSPQSAIDNFIDEGKKKIDKILNPSKYVRKDLSTKNAQNEKISTKKHQAEVKKQNTIKKDLNTIPVSEKQALREKARKQERINAALERDRARHKKEKENLHKITEKQANKRTEALLKKYESKEFLEKQQKKLDELIKNAKNLFCRDAKDSVKEDYEKHRDIPIKKVALTKDQDMAAINRGKRFYDIKKEQARKYADDPNKVMFDTGAYMNGINCANCTLAYDLRRRGYDVTAPEQTGFSEGPTMRDVLNWYKPKDKLSYGIYSKLTPEHATNNGIIESYGGRYTTAKSKTDGYSQKEIAKIEKELLKNPEGSYGFLNVGWVDGGGHAQVWSIENGHVVIRDTQINEKFTLEDTLMYSHTAMYFRADNLELSDKAYEHANATQVSGATVTKTKKRR